MQSETQREAMIRARRFGSCAKCGGAQGHDYALGGVFCTNPKCGQDTPPADSAGLVERIAQFLHDEGGFDEAWRATWPEHPDDTGQREGGFVRIVPSDVQAKFRDIARRLHTMLLAATTTQATEIARLREVVDALAVLMPIQVHDGRDYAEVFFAVGATHSTQAMTMNPQHWRDLADAYDRAALTGRQG